MGGGVNAEEFPLVLGSRDPLPTVRARFYQKRAFTIADGSRHTIFLFRAANCWLRERFPDQTRQKRERATRPTSRSPQ